MSTELQNIPANTQVAPVIDSGFMISIEELKKRASMVSRLKKECMIPDVHFGKIQGCGDKPTLLKNGAEFLCMAFRLSIDAKIEIGDLGSGHREYTIYTNLTSGGELVATGVGSCSTMESKYRYRGTELEPTGKPVPKEYWTAKDVNLLGGKGFTAKKDEGGNWMIFKKGDTRLENPDIADTYNTVLKMASKRSLVDAVLKATGGSCEFTQDIEDNPEQYQKQAARKATGFANQQKAQQPQQQKATAEDLSAYM